MPIVMSIPSTLFALLILGIYFLHLDEINFHCWNSSADIRQFKRENNLTDTGLLQYYFDNQFNTFPANKNPVYWQEVITMGRFLSLPSFKCELWLKVTHPLL